MMSDLQQSRIGVVIVNYNSGSYLAQCIESLNLSLSELDIVIVDNASRDNSLGLIPEIAAPHLLTVVENSENLGFSAAVNIGMRVIENQHAVLLNPDCTVFPSAFLKMQREMNEDPVVAIVGAAVFNQDGTEQRGCRRNEPTLKHSMVTAAGLGKRFEGVDLTYYEFPSKPIEVDAVSGAAMMVRKSCFDEVGGMDEGFFLHCEDLDICRRVRDGGYKVLFCPFANVIHHQGISTGVTSLQVEKHKHNGMLLYNKKYAGANHNRLNQILITILVQSHFLVTICKQAIREFLVKMGLMVGRNQTLVSEQNKFTALEIIKNNKPIVIVTGANSDVGDFLLQHLSNSEYKCIAAHRGVAPTANSEDSITWLNLEFFSKLGAEDMAPICAWINLAPVWTTSHLAESFKSHDIRRIISLSSTSIEGKSDSDAEKDTKVVRQLNEGEDWVKYYGEKYDIDTVVLRPTLIYGGPRNQSINFIEKLIRLIRCFPLISNGQGKRQPIHAEDVAMACILLLDKDAVNESTYNVAGGETLSYRHMVERIFQKLNIQPRFFELPLALAKISINIFKHVPGLGFLHPNMAQRMQNNLVYSNQDAIQDFSYRPRKFVP